jgi:hypothetical protein
MGSRQSGHGRAAVAAASSLAVAVLGAAPAQAAWGPILRPAASAAAGQVTLAVNASGDVGAAWAQESRGIVTVRAAVRRGTRPLPVRTLLSLRGGAVQGLAAVLDARGELTVAWVDRGPSRGGRGGAMTVRAAYRTPAGRWSRTRAISKTSAFFYAQPRLAAAPDGTVALTFNAAVRAAPGVGAAWRRPGRAFGRVQSVRTGRRRYLQEPTLAFDPAGRAYLAGIARCDDEQRSAGVLFVATRGARRFGAQRTITPAPANHLRFVVSGSGTGIAAWLRAGCSTSEDLSGAPQAALVRGASAGSPLLLDDRAGTGLTLSGAPGRGAEAAWTQYAPEAADGRVVVSRVAGEGAHSAPDVPVGGWAAVAAGRAGDQVVERLRPVSSGPPEAVGARPAARGGVEPAPFGDPGFFTVAAAPSGRALAAAVAARAFVRVSVWRPTEVTR